MTKILVLYYSTYGHIETMAYAAAEGARKGGADVVVKRVPELVPEEVAKKSHFKLDQKAPIATVPTRRITPMAADTTMSRRLSCRLDC